MQEDSDLILESEVKNNSWAIRPCHLYKGFYSKFSYFAVASDEFVCFFLSPEEYRDCRSIKARFQQYFVQGELLDCSSWEHDFENCSKFDEENDMKAAKKIIDNEASRRKERMKAHYSNNIWKKRKNPPEDWAKPLPEHLTRQYENSFLDIKNKEMKNIPISPEAAANSMQSSSFCTIM